MSRRAIALFDVDNTLTDLSTPDLFVDQVLRRGKSLRVRCADLARRAAAHLRLVPIDRLRLFKLTFLRGRTESELREAARVFVDDVVLPSLRPAVRARLEDHRKKGDRVVLISGGYDLYLDVLKERLAADGVVANRVAFQDGVCTGRIVGADCMGEEKVARLRQIYDVAEFDLAASTAYSDAPSDLPLLRFVGRGVIVSPTPAVAWNPDGRFQVWVPR